MTPRKFCEDCRFFSGSPARPDIAECMIPRADEAVLMVSRQAKPTARHCAIERSHNDDDSCGPDAKWFEAKVDPNVHKCAGTA